MTLRNSLYLLLAVLILLPATLHAKPSKKDKKQESPKKEQIREGKK